MNNHFIFHRTELANRLAQRILRAAPGSASNSGLFLSAPRRTGKSTFIREDLRPLLEKMKVVVIYIDLWANKKADPASVIISAIKEELSKHDGVITRLARSAGMDTIKVGGLSFSLDRVGLDKDISLSSALSALSDELGSPIVMIIDEAQHAITTKDGNDALFSLKAARDELNSSAHNGLHIVATGSNQAKLAMLTGSKDQAFFGAHTVRFPHLDMGYIEWLLNKLPFGEFLHKDRVMELFEAASYRPEIMIAAADEVQFDLSLQDEDIADSFSKAVHEQLAISNQDIVRVVKALTPIQFAVLKVLASANEDFSPFRADTIQKYQAVLDEEGNPEHQTFDVSTAQVALNALQDKMLIWKAARGMYSLEDNSLGEVVASVSSFSTKY